MSFNNIKAYNYFKDRKTNYQELLQYFKVPEDNTTGLIKASKGFIIGAQPVIFNGDVVYLHTQSEIKFSTGEYLGWTTPFVIIPNIPVINQLEV